jgi:hypothetical protein
VLGEPMTAPSSAYPATQISTEAVPKSREKEGVAERYQRVCLDLVEYIGQVES